MSGIFVTAQSVHAGVGDERSYVSTCEVRAAGMYVNPFFNVPEYLTPPTGPARGRDVNGVHKPDIIFVGW